MGHVKRPHLPPSIKGTAQHAGPACEGSPAEKIMVTVKLRFWTLTMKSKYDFQNGVLHFLIAKQTHYY